MISGKWDTFAIEMTGEKCPNCLELTPNEGRFETVFSVQENFPKMSGWGKLSHCNFKTLACFLALS